MDFIHLLLTGRSHFVRSFPFDIASLFLHHCLPDANIFIHNSFSPSLPDSLFLFGSIDGDVSSCAPMSQKVPGFSQQRTIPTRMGENVMKIVIHSKPS
jgi:hypothetical protein